MRNTSLLLLFIFCLQFASAQTDTDIFIYDLDISGGKISNEQNLTHWKGYDNQPHFSPEGDKLYFTRILNQADAYYYDFNLKVIREFTATPESEYSPVVTPDGKYISVVRVEQDSVQRLWKFPIPRGEAHVVLPRLKPVGYHAWVDNETVALFVLGNSNSLQLGNTRTEEVKTITYDIGRSMHAHNGSVYFIHKESSLIWWIKKLDIATGGVSRVVQTIEGREDFTVTPSGKILMGDGEKIYEYRSGKWKKFITIKTNAYTDFNRITVSRDERKLALVAVME